LRPHAGGAPVPDDRPVSFLIVCLRYIGDVLLSTPLALSIKTHLPQAQIDYLVFEGTGEVLAKNPHVRRVHTLAPASSGLGTLLQLWRRYDYAIGTGWSDRTAFFCFACGRHSRGFRAADRQDWWKSRLLEECRLFDGRMHVVPLMLTQLESLGIPAIPRVVMSYNDADAHFARRQLGDRPCILLHPYSRRDFKYWPASAWAKLAGMIRSSLALRAVFTRAQSEADQEQFRRIQAQVGGAADCIPVSLTWQQLAAAIHTSRAFVGVDTAATHVAAAVGAPTIALYGPTPSAAWGPWPNDWPGTTPFLANGQTQVCGQITILQQSWPCTPCSRETCFISRRGKIECLEDLAPETVFDALSLALQAAPDSSPLIRQPSR
jgi:heptosyltransferase III